MDTYRFILTAAMLWHSSFAIEYYYMDQWCANTINAEYEQIRLKLTANAEYAPNMKCQVTINAHLENRLMIYFKDMDIEQSGTCKYDFLEMDDGISRDDPYIGGGKKCGQSTPSEIFTTSGQYLTLYFQSDKSDQFRGFDMIITPFHTGHCNDDEYRCDNGRCIDDSFTCNDYNPCGDYSDCEVRITAFGIVGIVFGGILFVIFTILVVAICRRRRTIVVQQATPIMTGYVPTYGYNQSVPAQNFQPPPYSIATNTTCQKY